MGEQLRDQQRVVGGEAARECPAKLRQLSPQLAARQLRQGLGVVSALTKLGEHRPPGGAEHPRRDRRELDVGVLEQLL